MTKLELRLAAVIIVLALLLLGMAIALGSVLESQQWYTEQVSTLRSENSALQKEADRAA